MTENTSSIWSRRTKEKSTFLASAGVRQGASESLIGDESGLGSKKEQEELDQGHGQGHGQVHGQVHGQAYGQSHSYGQNQINSLEDSSVEDEINEDGLRIVKTNNGSNILPASWKFWFLHRGPGQKISNYLEATKQVGSFDTAEEFWDLYSHLRRIDKLPFTSEYQLFRKGVKPMWEDAVNVNGGKWVVRFKRPKERRREDGVGVVGGNAPGISAATTVGAPSSTTTTTDSPQVIAANRALAHKQAQARHKAALTWENLILSIVGNTLGEDEEIEDENEEGAKTTNNETNNNILDLPSDEIIGAVVSVRRDEDIISVWNRSGNDREIINKIKSALQRNLNLPSDITLEYKVHSESIKEGAEKQATYDQLRHQQPSSGANTNQHQNKNGHHHHHHNNNYHQQSHSGHYNNHHHKTGHFHHSGFHGPIGKNETGSSNSASASTTSVDL